MHRELMTRYLYPLLDLRANPFFIHFTNYNLRRNIYVNMKTMTVLFYLDVLVEQINLGFLTEINPKPTFLGSLTLLGSFAS